MGTQMSAKQYICLDNVDVKIITALVRNNLRSTTLCHISIQLNNIYTHQEENNI